MVSCSRDPGPWLFNAAGQGLVVLGVGGWGAAGFGLAEALEGWCVCSRDERETAGSWAVSLFPFHPRAGGQSLD